MKTFFYCYLMLFAIISSSQEKSIAFFDEKKEAITDFQLNFFIKDSLSIYKSNSSNSYTFKESMIKEIDSVFIVFDSFYSQKLIANDFKKDIIFLKKGISLDEIIIDKQFERTALGVVSKNRNIRKVWSTSRSDEIIEIDVKDHIGASIETISLYLYQGFRDVYNTKHSNKNANIKFYLFQSNSGPNDGVENLLKKELIVNNEAGKKGWINIDLSKLHIKIKDYKYLYLGYSAFGNPIVLGTVRRKRMTSGNTITSYIKYLDNIIKDEWLGGSRMDVTKEWVSEIAIKIDIKH